MGAKYNFHDADRFLTSLSAFTQKAADATVEAIGEALDTAVEDIKHTIRISVTKTGIKRAQDGIGEPGRIEHGDMINAVTSEMQIEGDVIIGSAGWLHDNKGREHAAYQEPGTERVEGMRALFSAHSLVANEMKKRLKDKGFPVE